MHARTAVAMLGREPIVVRPKFCKTDSSSSRSKHATLADGARAWAREIRTIPPARELFGEGDLCDSFYVVLAGWLFQHRILEDGRRQILDFALPGAVLGISADESGEHGYSVDSICEAQLAVLPRASLGEVLAADPEFAVNLLMAAQRALDGAFDGLTDIGRRTALEAVAHFLIRMEKRIRVVAEPRPDGFMYFPLIQEHIGDALGLTAVHVCRTLRRLRREGLVEIGRGRLRIIDRRGLSQAAGMYVEEANPRRLAS